MGLTGSKIGPDKDQREVALEILNKNVLYLFSNGAKMFHLTKNGLWLRPNSRPGSFVERIGRTLTAVNLDKSSL